MSLGVKSIPAHTEEEVLHCKNILTRNLKYDKLQLKTQSGWFVVVLNITTKTFQPPVNHGGSMKP